MISLRVNHKADIRREFSEFLSSVFLYDWESAEEHLDRFEDLLMQHLITRNNGGKTVQEIIRLIRLYLREPRCAQDKKRLLLEKVNLLLSKISFDGGLYGKTPIEKLNSIYSELRDDWADFWSAPAEDKVSTLVEDLERIGLLEGEFRKESDDIYKQFRQILTARGRCFTVIPLLNALARGHTLNEAKRDSIFERFSLLFSEIEKIMAPKGFKFAVEEKGEEKKPKLMLVSGD